MIGVIQSGLVTPNHVATWVTPGVISDGGPVATGRVMISARSINFNTTNDQPIVFPQWIAAFRLATIIVTNASVSLTSAVGGFYPASSKGGTPIVSAAQAYSALTTPAGLMTATLASFGSSTRFSSANLGTIGGLLAIWFSLSVSQGVSATGDIFFVVDNLS